MDDPTCCSGFLIWVVGILWLVMVTSESAGWRAAGWWVVVGVVAAVVLRGIINLLMGKENQ